MKAYNLRFIKSVGFFSDAFYKFDIVIKFLNCQRKKCIEFMENNFSVRDEKLCSHNVIFVKGATKYSRNRFKYMIQLSLLIK